MSCLPLPAAKMKAFAPVIVVTAGSAPCCKRYSAIAKLPLWPLCYESYRREKMFTINKHNTNKVIQYAQHS
jgi:hypothetical protein